MENVESFEEYYLDRTNNDPTMYAIRSEQSTLIIDVRIGAAIIQHTLDSDDDKCAPCMRNPFVYIDKRARTVWDTKVLLGMHLRQWHGIDCKKTILGLRQRNLTTPDRGDHIPLPDNSELMMCLLDSRSTITVFLPKIIVFPTWAE